MLKCFIVYECKEHVGLDLFKWNISYFTLNTTVKMVYLSVPLCACVGSVLFCIRYFTYEYIKLVSCVLTTTASKLIHFWRRWGYFGTVEEISKKKKLQVVVVVYWWIHTCTVCVTFSVQYSKNTLKSVLCQIEHVNKGVHSLENSE